MAATSFLLSLLPAGCFSPYAPQSGVTVLRRGALSSVSAHRPSGLHRFWMRRSQRRARTPARSGARGSPHTAAAADCTVPRSPLMVSSPRSTDTSSFAGSLPGANATTSIESSVAPMLTCGKAPERPGTDAGWEPAKEARHLLLQTVEPR